MSHMVTHPCVIVGTELEVCCFPGRASTQNSLSIHPIFRPIESACPVCTADYGTSSTYRIVDGQVTAQRIELACAVCTVEY